VKEEITHIIETCRCGEEMFFTDSKEAANRIVAYLELNNMLVKVAPVIELFAA
jgi:hypothetical protein